MFFHYNMIIYSHRWYENFFRFLFLAMNILKIQQNKFKKTNYNMLIIPTHLEHVKYYGKNKLTHNSLTHNSVEIHFRMNDGWHNENGAHTEKWSVFQIENPNCIRRMNWMCEKRASPMVFRIWVTIRHWRIKKEREKRQIEIEFEREKCRFRIEMAIFYHLTLNIRIHSRCL